MNGFSLYQNFYNMLSSTLLGQPQTPSLAFVNTCCKYNGQDAILKFYSDDSFTILLKTTGAAVPTPDLSLLDCCGEVQEGTLTYITEQSTGIINIPAGAYYVNVKVAGVTSSTGSPLVPLATIDGMPADIGRDFPLRAVYDYYTKTFKKLPAIIVNGNGAQVWVVYAI